MKPFSYIVIDELKREVHADGIEIELQHNEFELAAHFRRNAGIAFTREQLIELVWKNENVADRVVDVAVCRLRRKLPGFPIKTLPRHGYKLTAAVQVHT